MACQREHTCTCVYANCFAFAILQGYIADNLWLGSSSLTRGPHVSHVCYNQHRLLRHV